MSGTSSWTTELIGGEPQLDEMRWRELRSRDTAAWGIHLSLLCPEAVELFGLLGFEWVLLDAQHMPLDPRLCCELVRAADLACMPCLVRVPDVSPAIVERFLDVGAAGILAPDISSAGQAHALVAAVKFSPEGTRGAAGRSRAAGYGLIESPAEYTWRANRATMTGALIETQAGIDALESIMAVPGLDFVGLGPNDLGLSLGTAAGMADPAIRKIVEAARARIKAYGKPEMTVVSDADAGNAAVSAGARLIAVSDAALLATATREFLHSKPSLMLGAEKGVAG
jgi:4-hydroxy-2-oxoheptanedioate aldolase